MAKRRRPPSRPAASTAAARPLGAARVAEGRQSPATRPADALPSRPPGRQPRKRETTSMRLGLRPYGWTRAAFCDRCGPVWIPPWLRPADRWWDDWCPWCFDATAHGVEIVERPFVTCEGCRYFMRHPRPGERGACAIGQVAYQPDRPHECSWWRP